MVTATFDELVPDNILLKFFMTSWLMMSIGAILFIYENFMAVSYGNQINSFVDLCTLSNISLVMLDEHFHGYYIHGKAPWGSSDIPIDWL